jgi:hypothetical protein
MIVSLKTHTLGFPRCLVARVKRRRLVGKRALAPGMSEQGGDVVLRCGKGLDIRSARVHLGLEQRRTT